MSPTRKEIFNRTPQKVEKLRVINQPIDKVIILKTAAEMLRLRKRQVIRFKGGVLHHGLFIRRQFLSGSRYPQH